MLWKIQVDEFIVLNNLYSGRKISKGVAKNKQRVASASQLVLMPY